MEIHPGGFDPEAWEAVRKSSLSQEQAKTALLYVAACAREGRPLPLGVAEWLAGAIETAMQDPGKLVSTGDPGAALLVALGLKATNRRRVCDWLDVGPRVQALIEDEGLSEQTAIERVAEENRVSPKTVMRNWKVYVDTEEECARIARDECE